MSLLAKKPFPGNGDCGGRRLSSKLPQRRDEELNQLLAWINGDCDALTTLQRTYMDPRISTSDRIKAAGAAIAYERTKLTLAVSVRSSDVLGDRLDAARVNRLRPIGKFGPY